jgi:hypothetical protein
MISSISKGLVPLFFLLSFLTQAQDSFSKTTSELSFENSSEERFIEVYVSENSLSVHFLVSCQLTQGSMSVIISNSDTGKNYGAISVGGSKTNQEQNNNTFTEQVQSDINKVINSPEPGFYVVKIKTQDAKALLNITIEQYAN